MENLSLSQSCEEFVELALGLEWIPEREVYLQESGKAIEGSLDFILMLTKEAEYTVTRLVWNFTGKLVSDGIDLLSVFELVSPAQAETLRASLIDNILGFTGEWDINIEGRKYIAATEEEWTEVYE
jgi:hypothetical protein